MDAVVKHLDLFSGIGGFALAAKWTWGDEYENVGHSEVDKFCCQVYHKHFPESRCLGDITKVDWDGVVADTNGSGSRTSGRRTNDYGAEKNERRDKQLFSKFGRYDIDLLTGGFPCQPFSVAGKRRGKEDDRYLWPETIRAIREARPRYVCLENVAGLVSILEPESLSEVEIKEIQLFHAHEGYESNEVVERVHRRIVGKILDDLNEAGYVLPRYSDGTPIVLVVPACSLNAPHRRDRVWIIAHTKSHRGEREPREVYQTHGRQIRELHIGLDNADSHASDTTRGRFKQRLPITEAQRDTGKEGIPFGNDNHPERERLEGYSESGDDSQGRAEQSRPMFEAGWSRNWYEVATRLCRVDDGLPRRMDRVNRLKALGNAIVPQIAYVILKAIKDASNPSP